MTVTVLVMETGSALRSRLHDMIVARLQEHPDVVVEVRRMEDEFIYGKSASHVVLDDMHVPIGFVRMVMAKDEPVLNYKESRQARVERLRGSRW